MKKMILATAALALLGSASVIAPTLAQSLSPKTGGAPAASNSAPSSAGAIPEAPIGHRQPTRGDVPAESGKNNPNNPNNIDAQDKELDRKIKGICKGC